MGTISSGLYQTRSAVLFLAFNRPATARQVFAQIKATKPKRLYMAADAPRDNKPGENMLCNEVREIVKDIDWDCEVKTLFREKHGGCKEAVSSAISWFFDHEEEGIILEDDCVPCNSFFRFCDTLLEKYRFDTRVRHIAGCNFQKGNKWGGCSYYFSNISHVWGWASWKRVWKDYDKDLTGYYENDVTRQLGNVFNDPIIVESWVNVFKRIKAAEIDSWAYPLSFINFFNNSLCIIPNENLVSNIGFDENATHTVNTNNPNAHIPVHEIAGMNHPKFFLPEKRADVFTLNNEFNVDEKRRKRKLLHKRVKNWFKSFLYNDNLITESSS
jgi:hypothetical protein